MHVYVCDGCSPPTKRLPHCSFLCNMTTIPYFLHRQKNINNIVPHACKDKSINELVNVPLYLLYNSSKCLVSVNDLV